MLEFYSQPCFLLSLFCSNGNFCVLNAVIEKCYSVYADEWENQKKRLFSKQKQADKEKWQEKTRNQIKYSYCVVFEKHKMLSFNSASMAEPPLMNSKMWQEWKNWLQARPACGLIGH